jgi:hypothetical protein
MKLEAPHFVLAAQLPLKIACAPREQFISNRFKQFSFALYI